MGKRPIPAYPQPTKDHSLFRRAFETTAHRLSRHRYDTLRGCRKRFSHGIRSRNHRNRATVESRGKDTGHRHEQPQSDRGEHGGQNGADRCRFIFHQSLLRPASSQRRCRHTVGRRKLYQRFAEYRPGSGTILYLVRKGRRGYRRNESLWRRRLIE